MNYKVIMEKRNYALIMRGKEMNEYAVVYGLNKSTKEWDHTCCYYNYYIGLNLQASCTQAEALFLALDYFRTKTETDYIPYCRMGELATLLKDGLIETDEAAMEYFDEVCEMTEEEKEYFGIYDENESEKY